MDGLYFLVPTLLVIFVSFLIIRAAAVALMMTGMDEKKAKFQALSAFSGTGFTTKEAESVPPGSNGLLFIPLYIFRKGTIHGLGWHHGRAHFARAIMESAALSAQMLLTLIEGFGGTKTEVLKSDGGAMNSSFWAQIFADVTNKKILIPENKDGAAMGAAILAFYGCEKFNSLTEAINQMVRFSDEKNPNKDNAKIYKKLNRIFMPKTLETLEKQRVTKNL